MYKFFTQFFLGILIVMMTTAFSVLFTLVAPRKLVDKVVGIDSSHKNDGEFYAIIVKSVKQTFHKQAFLGFITGVMFGVYSVFESLLEGKKD